MKKKSISECAIIGFDHGLPCRVKNMALGPQLRQKPRPSASVFVYWVPRAMFFTRHGRPWSNPTWHLLQKKCILQTLPFRKRTSKSDSWTLERTWDDDWHSQVENVCRHWRYGSSMFSTAWQDDPTPELQVNCFTQNEEGLPLGSSRSPCWGWPSRIFKGRCSQPLSKIPR